MQRTLEDFLRALRAADLSVSPAEAIDAHRAVTRIGYSDRELFRDSLCVTLAKNAEAVAKFESCFDAFFQRDTPTRSDPEDDAETVDADTGYTETGDTGRNPLIDGDATDLAQAIEAAARQIGVSDIRLTTQRNLMVRRLLDQIGLRQLEARINLERAAGGDGAADQLGLRRDQAFDAARAFVDRQARLYAGETGRRLREELLAGQNLTAIEPEDLKLMQTLVRKMAKRLASRYARKRRTAKIGRLDVRRTLAASMPHGGVPFELIWKSQVVHKPKIVVICDVSRSVAAAAQFLLLFLYSLNEVVERLDAFAFSDRLIDVGDVLDDEKVDDATSLILSRIGFRPTNYGQALADFFDAHGAKLDRRTTVIVLGDGRTNYIDPRLDLARAIAERSRALIWLNPEPETYWDQGDSRMSDYRRFCHVAKTCNTLKQLERIIEDVLRTYLPR